MFSCKDCEDRYPGCHDHCKRYKAEKKKRDDCKARQDQDKNYRDYRRDQRNKRLRENAKRRNLTREYYKF